MTENVEAAPLAIPESELDDLRERLARTRWPAREPVADWSQGVPLARVQGLCEYWRTNYDWRRCEAMLNGWNPRRTVVDGLGIHFLHVRSPEPDALPVVMTHGWPGSVIEFNKVVGSLTDPVAHGGEARDALHLVLPSLPGHGFSDKPAEPGWGVPRIADAWAELMRRLGYGDRWAAQGGDWGGAVVKALGAKAPAGCIGLHTNMAIVRPTEEEVAGATPEEKAMIAEDERFGKTAFAYALEQQTRPQTIGTALADTPAGQAAWIYEKFWDWTGLGKPPEEVFTRDELLDNIMLYWLPNAGASSARLYWESLDSFADDDTIKLPVAFSVFPRDTMRASRRWAERRCPRLVYWNEPARGGHFAAFEQPSLFVEEVREGLRAVREAAAR